jgi:hypothetical protein
MRLQDTGGGMATVDIPIFYSFFVDYNVGSLTGAVKE